MAKALAARVSDAPPPRRLYSVKDAAELLSVDKNTVYQLAYSGRLATVKLGRRRLVPSEALDALIAELRP